MFFLFFISIFFIAEDKKQNFKIFINSAFNYEYYGKIRLFIQRGKERNEDTSWRKRRPR